jgi:hypothetical protein
MIISELATLVSVITRHIGQLGKFTRKLTKSLYPWSNSDSDFQLRIYGSKLSFSGKQKGKNTPQLGIITKFTYC